jgi:hypothetical protein
LALPARRITVNLAPADVPKEAGSHYDLPIAPADGRDRRHPGGRARGPHGKLVSFGSTARSPVAGVLPAAISQFA